MNKTLLIFKHEFKNTIKHIGFAILTLAVPLLGLIAIGVTEMVTQQDTEVAEWKPRIGLVDLSETLADPNAESLEGFTLYPTEPEAKTSLIEGAIDEYFVVPPEYPASGTVTRYTLQKELDTPGMTRYLIKRFLTANLVGDDVSSETVSLLAAPLNLQVVRLDAEGQVSTDQGNIANVIIPGVFAMLLGFALMFGATSLISGLGEEKESRLIEVLLSSVSIRQLLLGKVLAMGLAGLLQVLVWLLSAPLLLKLASSRFGGFLNDVQLPANFIALGIAYFVLGYLLFAVLSIGVGAISPNAREGGQLSLFYVLLAFAPLWFSSLLLAFPNSPVWIAFSLFPGTSPVQMMLRLGVSDIPSWQVVASFVLLAVSIVAGMYVSIRVFRVYMLMYGNRPRLSEILRSVKTEGVS